MDVPTFKLHPGLCLACGRTHPVKAPDSKRMRCEVCGSDAVYGSQALTVEQILEVLNVLVTDTSVQLFLCMIAVSAILLWGSYHH